MQKKPKRRHRKLIKPRLQLSLTRTFAGLTLLAFLLQILLFGAVLANSAQYMPLGGDHLTAMIPRLLGTALLLSSLILLPTVVLVGVLTTFRVAGPVYRFETYLRQVSRGEAVGPCRIREGDELQELCGLINEATEPLRRGTEHDGSAREREAASRPEAA